jgi:hypothetical protein
VCVCVHCSTALYNARKTSDGHVILPTGPILTQNFTPVAPKNLEKGDFGLLAHATNYILLFGASSRISGPLDAYDMSRGILWVGWQVLEAQARIHIGYACETLAVEIITRWQKSVRPRNIFLNDEQNPALHAYSPKNIKTGRWTFLSTVVHEHKSIVWRFSNSQRGGSCLKRDMPIFFCFLFLFARKHVF